MTMAAVSLAAILSGCVTTEQRLVSASATAGAMAAGLNLPQQPDECRVPMDRVVPKEGEKARWVQKRWEIVADQADKRTAYCATFYDDVKTGFATVGTGSK